MISKKYNYLFAKPRSGENIAQNISKLLSNLGNHLNYKGKIMGHLKAIAMSGENYLQLSLTSLPQVNAKSDSNWYKEGYTELELNINIIIYGFGKEQVQAYLDESLKELSANLQ